MTTEGQSLERMSDEYPPPPEKYFRNGDDGLPSKREEYTFPATDTVVDTSKTCNVDVSPGSTSINTVGNTRKRKFSMVDNLEDEASWERDDEYVPGSQRSKYRTRVGRKLSKTCGGRGAKQHAKRVGSSSKANASTVEFPSQPDLARHESRKHVTEELSSNDITPGPSGRPIKHRKLVKEIDDYPSHLVGDEYWQQSKPATPEQMTPEPNEMRRVNATDDSAGIEDSDGDFNPDDDRRTRKPSVQRAKRTSTKSRRRHLEQHLSRGADRAADERQGSLSETSTEVVQQINGKYKCPHANCGKFTKSKGDMKRHLESLQHQKKRYECPSCSVTFTRTDSLKRHIGSSHPEIVV